MNINRCFIPLRYFVLWTAGTPLGYTCIKTSRTNTNLSVNLDVTFSVGTDWTPFSVIYNFMNLSDWSQAETKQKAVHQ